MLVITPLADRVGLRLDGEVDLSTCGELRRALTALPAEAREVHFDLSGLRFIEVIGTRELMSTAEGDPPRRLVLHHPPRALGRVLAIVWRDRAVELRGSQLCISGAPGG